MRVIVICRLMSGWADSIRAGQWAPSGGMAIAKMVEELDQRGALTGLLLLSHHPDINSRSVQIEGISRPVTVAGHCYSLLQGIWAHRLTALRHFLASLVFVLSRQADIVYVDRGSVLAARLLAGWPWRKAVVIRLLGASRHLWEGLSGRALSLRLRHWAFRGAFSAVLCSRDGTPGQAWMAQALAPSTPRFHWLNGVDLPHKDTHKCEIDLSSSCVRVLWLGRINKELKRTDLFVSAILTLYQQNPGLRAQFFIVGEGPLRHELEQRVIDAGAQDIVQFTGALAHKQAQDMVATSDILVSLNEDGQLANTNLEALAHGLCFIFSQVKGGESITDVIPHEAVLWINEDNLCLNLQEALLRLINNPEELATRRQAASKAACRLLSWQERIRREWDLLSSISPPC